MSLPEIKTRPTARIELPVQYLRLRDIAYNLWWSWSPRAQALFEMIDEQHWLHYRSPIEVLIDLEPDRWRFLQNNERFIRAYRGLVDEFDAYMAPHGPTWFQQRYRDYSGGPIAYCSTEFGWHESLQIYSGGLGVLSGDHSKSASDLGLPFIGLSLMYKRGYFRQTVDAEGRQQHFHPHYDRERLPLLPVLDPAGRDLRVAVELSGRSVDVRVWKACVGRVPVLLLDTDIPSNHPADRTITSMLYVSGREMRLCQEIVLGIGGVRVLEALEIEPAVWHMNEGHSALVALERMAQLMKQERVSLDDAVRRVARNTVFTTHTPVPAGNEIFDGDLIRKHFTRWVEIAGGDVDRLLALGRAGDDTSANLFNMTALALRTSTRANGVSELHGQVATDLWKPFLEGLVAAKRIDEPRIGHVTNGVHQPSWIGPELGLLLERHLGHDYGERLLEPGFADAVDAIPDAEVWAARRAQKARLIAMSRACALEQLARHGRSPDELSQVDGLFDPEVLLIGFARRFATYKRADLLLRDVERIRAIANHAEHPVQFLFAGKAHPADRPGQELIQRIFEAALTPELKPRLLFLENYDMRIGRGMVQGVDVWLNNPRRPMEASGTSGMKAAMNGVLNCSALDGWWCEGYDPSHGWTIGEPRDWDDKEAQDQHDADALYRVVGEEIAPLYYRRDERGLPVEWIARMKRAIGTLSGRFSTARMVREYTEAYYVSGLEASRPARKASAVGRRGDGADAE